MITHGVCHYCMSGRFFTLFCSSLFVLAAFVHNVEAQNTLPAVDISCETGTINIGVNPGSTALGYSNCTASNPTVYQEEVEITVLSDGLPNTGSGKVNIGPGAEIEFQISFKAEIGMLMQSRSWSVEAVVISANGVPPPNDASSKVQGIINIMQYSDLSITGSESAIDINAGSSFEIEVFVENLGNHEDFFMIGLNCNRDCNLEDEGFVVTGGQRISLAPSSTSDQPASIIFEITAPDKVGKENSFFVEFYATSEFSCRNEGLCKTQYTSLLIDLSEDGSKAFSDALFGETGLIVGAIVGSIVVAAVIVVLIRRKTSVETFDEEYEDEFEHEDEEEFEDDLDDDFFDDL